MDIFLVEYASTDSQGISTDCSVHKTLEEAKKEVNRLFTQDRDYYELTKDDLDHTDRTYKRDDIKLSIDSWDGNKDILAYSYNAYNSEHQGTCSVTALFL